MDGVREASSQAEGNEFHSDGNAAPINALTKMTLIVILEDIGNLVPAFADPHIFPLLYYPVDEGD